MRIHSLFDRTSSTLTHIIWDETTRDAVIIDPVLDFDPQAVSVSTASNDEVVAYTKQHDLKVHYIFETHAHADHLSGGHDLRRRLGAKLAIGEHITMVQATFKRIFNLPPDFPIDGSQFDKLVTHGERLSAGSLTIEVLHTPGHTPACVTYKIGDAVFTGDALFMPDFGTGRCDFPDGSAEDLFASVQERLYALPDDTRVFVGHDYGPGGREIAWETTIGESKKHNIQLSSDTDRDQFVAFRSSRDATLSPPKLLFHAVQINVDAGKLPPPEANGQRYLRLPMGLFDRVQHDLS